MACLVCRAVDSTSCTACPDGHKCASGLDKGPCHPGTYRPVMSGSTTTVCVPCQPGDHQPSSGATACLTCGGGTTSNLARDGCEPCPAGSFRPANAATFVCTPCPAGTLTAAPGRDSCDPCPDGTTSAAGSAVCVPV